MFRRLPLLLRVVTVQAWRALIFLVGAAVVLIGVVLLPLPGPGSLVVVLGLAILGMEFVWARHGLAHLQSAARRARDWAKSKWLPARTPVASPAATVRKRSTRIRRPA
jgi:uncharacterized protein (TIGR02611 family)